jgi:ribonuclease HI
MKYYTDGSSTIGIKSAFCVTDEKGIIKELIETVNNPFTNNEEEYRGVIAALELCEAGDIICTDSLLVFNQVNGKYKVKQPHLKPLCDKVKYLIDKKCSFLKWIPREENLAGKVFEK